ncbi:MAG: hypothetical protein BWY52_00525 [Chloroflexi bacterium ADurb.Bin325]|nr:MAG: hypothetical protein BWY52_00525 [Chloroflexi bacterium ADurb.Bin325]
MMNEQTETHRPRRRSARSTRQPGWRRVWQRYRFEIIWALAVAAGLFLLIEDMDIRETLFRWLRGAMGALFRGGAQLSQQIEQMLRRLTASDLIGSLLILAATVALLWRVRWRLRRSETFTALRCPRCGGSVYRKHRRSGDRLISIFVPVRRYRCANSECRWQGLRVTPVDGAPRPLPARNPDAH